MTVKLLTEHYLEFLSLKGGCKGSSESTLVKLPHCWKSHSRSSNVKCCFLQLCRNILKFVFAAVLIGTLGFNTYLQDKKYL